MPPGRPGSGAGASVAVAVESANRLAFAAAAGRQLELSGQLLGRFRVVGPRLPGQV